MKDRTWTAVAIVAASVMLFGPSLLYVGCADDDHSHPTEPPIFTEPEPASIVAGISVAQDTNDMVTPFSVNFSASPPNSIVTPPSAVVFCHWDFGDFDSEPSACQITHRYTSASCTEETPCEYQVKVDVCDVLFPENCDDANAIVHVPASGG